MDNFSRPDPPGQTAFSVAKAGYPFILASAFITAVFALLELTVLSLTGLAVTIFICYFFRDPDRVVTNKNSAVVSPADGKVVEACIKNSNPYFEGRCLKISIFMSVFNVHVNRIPHEGKVEKINYYPGKFISANFNKASTDNERNAVFIKTNQGKKYCVVQIAGLIARRIICEVHDGDKMARGQRFGMICFGSRLDVYLPDDTKLNVCIEDRVKAGTSILGYLT
ncbi:MAG: phosphatidylserine decarboxylase family protein [Desulfobacteraceae bacterium]|uniref:Phosphatidylserine decarboxylase proenzyme n=1 Tax=Candidatus Desulfaltia bathyphila TaxID=2841697 RepID=A0A8J6N465_9BACT|nr:phosphatidylserine decarboxylase family protein [Candidatus Desulfaltia bathyphila]MBL7194681.1 phosphatidylserine decarboxylase family protein [Desulfobacterales bacterium]